MNNFITEPFTPRRPLIEDRPDEYMESDREYVMNNLALAVRLLDNWEEQLRIVDELVDEIIAERKAETNLP